MALALVLLALTFMGFTGYTMALQRLFHVLLEHAPPAASDRTEAVVLLRVYINKLNLAFALGMVVYAVARQHADWPSGVLLLLLCTLGGRLLSSAWLQPRTPRMLAALAAELERQRTRYQKRGKTAKLQAVEALLTRIHTLQRGGITGRTR